jgi:hypothetical protein
MKSGIPHRWFSEGADVAFQLVLLLGILRRAPRPSATRGQPCAHLLSMGAMPLNLKKF